MPSQNGKKMLKSSISYKNLHCCVLSIECTEEYRDLGLGRTHRLVLKPYKNSIIIKILEAEHHKWLIF